LETLDADVVSKLEEYFFTEDVEMKIADLYRQIDQALENDNHELFLQLSAEVNQLLEKKALVTE
jgi:uncharacterized protein YpiB (UPF0302 family)